MSEPVSREQMERYLKRKMSADELLQFDEALKQSGLAPNVPRPAGSLLLDDLRPENDEPLFDDEVKLDFVKGDLDIEGIRSINQLRRFDRDLDETLNMMEAAKRQVDASLQMAASEVRLAKPKRKLFAWGLATACVAAMAFWIAHEANSASLAPTLFAVNTDMSRKEPSQFLMASMDVDPKPDVQITLASLASHSTDSARLTPSRCLVLPSATTHLEWDGIKATSVKCTLKDGQGATLADATVTTGTGWNYKKVLAAGNYTWSASWTNAAGQQKVASRNFRVVDESTAKSIMQKLKSIDDPLEQSRMLAKEGYTYQSLQMIEQIAKADPNNAQLKKLKDKISFEATLG